MRVFRNNCEEIQKTQAAPCFLITIQTGNLSFPKDHCCFRNGTILGGSEMTFAPWGLHLHGGLQNIPVKHVYQIFPEFIGLFVESSV